MELVRVLFTTLVSVGVLFILTKIMGNRQMSQLSMFDYVEGITIGSIAAELATSDLKDFMNPLIAMVVYGLVSTLMSILTCKSVVLRRIITGKPLILYEDGKIYEKNLLKAKLDIGEFLTQCRNSQYFDLSQVHTAILESNGRISFLPMAQQRPTNPADLNLSPAQEKLLSNVIVDGKIMKHNLRATGNDEVWLQTQIQEQGVEDVSEIILGTCSEDNKLSIYRKLHKEMKQDVFS